MQFPNSDGLCREAEVYLPIYDTRVAHSHSTLAKLVRAYCYRVITKQTQAQSNITSKPQGIILSRDYEQLILTRICLSFLDIRLEWQTKCLQLGEV